MNEHMDYQEAANRIEEHMAIHHVQEYPHAQKITEALRLAVTVLRSIGSVANQPIRCPECGDVLECMCAVGADKSHSGLTERLYHCHNCLSSWSESTNEQTGEIKFERYFFG